MSPQQIQFVKLGVKLAFGLGTSILLGTIYKTGKETEEKIDAYFTKKYPQQDTKNV